MPSEYLVADLSFLNSLIRNASDVRDYGGLVTAVSRNSHPKIKEKAQKQNRSTG